MSEKPKRKFWQFHLATAVFMTLLAGTFLGVNLVPYNFTFVRPSEMSGFVHRMKAQGWPMRFHFIGPSERPFHDGWVNEGTMGYRPEIGLDGSPMTYRQPDEYYPGDWEMSNLAVNFIVSLGLVILCATGFEFILRRREARKT
jgi:hypothetical protein